MSKLSPFTQRRGNILYFRVAVPIELRQTLGVREIIKSLNTQDKSVAMPIALLMAATTKQFFTRLASMSKKEKDFDLMLIKAKHSLAINELKEQHDQEVSELVSKFNKDIEAARLSTERDVLSRIIKDRLHSPVAIKESKSVEVLEAAAKPTIKHKLPEVLPIWQSLKKPAKSSIQVYQNAVKIFTAVHPSVHVESITRRHVQDFISSRESDGVSAVTIEKDYAAIRSLLGIAQYEKWIADNPASEMILPKVKRNKRRGYTVPELQLIFDSPVFTMNDRPQEAKGEAAFWMPLLMLYTGARREELGRLRTNSIIDVEGVAAIKFEEVEGETFKTEATSRTVPIHKQLLELGFTDYVKDCVRSKHELLFQLLSKNILGQYAAKWGDWWGDYIRLVLKITDPKISPAHSFRHGFITECRRTAMRTDFERALVGHTDRTPKMDAHDEYGEIPIKTLKDALDRVEYRGLDLSKIDLFNKNEAS
jgi:integrase